MKEIQMKMKDFLKEKSLELQGFVEETTEKSKKEAVVLAEAETDMGEFETVELADSDSDYEFDSI